MTGPVFPRDYHRHDEHSWRNNRHELDEYYQRNESEPNCLDNNPGQHTGLSILLALIAVVILAAYTIAKTDESAPAAYEPTTVNANIDRYTMDLYKYYSERSR